MNALRAIIRPSRSIESVRPLTADERRSLWAAKYFALGHHRKPAKPRIKVTVSRQGGNF